MTSGHKDAEHRKQIQSSKSSAHLSKRGGLVRLVGVERHSDRTDRVGQPDVILPRVGRAAQVGMQPPVRHVGNPSTHPVPVGRGPDGAVGIAGLEQGDAGERVADPCQLDGATPAAFRRVVGAVVAFIVVVVISVE